MSDDPLGLNAADWLCMVCHDERPYALIGVAHRRIANAEDLYARYPAEAAAGTLARVNVRYCTDRKACITVASRGGVWPEPIVVLQHTDVLRVTDDAVAERAWASRSRRLPAMAFGMLTWLRDGPAQLSTLFAAYDEPAQQVFDTARDLVGMGLVERVAR